jgi:hypothetical protein
MGTGQASIELYNQRLAAAQNYLAGNNPVNMMAQVGSATNLGQQYYPGRRSMPGSPPRGPTRESSGAASAYGTS